MSKILTGAVTILFAAEAAQGQLVTNSSSTSLNSELPVGQVGLTFPASFSDVSGVISSVSVTLDITGGFNGDLYAYLVGPGGQMAVLLNRPGLSGSNPFGYADPGFDVTLSDGSPNIHYYQSDPSYSGDGQEQVTGTWAPDGRNVDPGNTPGTVYDQTAPTADFSVFDNTSANGQWTLFITDMSSGAGDGTIVNWGLTVVTVPEPSTWVLLAGGVGVLMAFNCWRKR
jgi:subtilisin-like proprotein convertase family protein